MEKFYIATAIPYTSGKPHIGNIYEMILADSIARYKRLKNYDVFFQTGTDEHGEKVEKNAIKNNLTPKEYVDNISFDIRKILDKMNVSYDSFIRTTDQKHIECVQKIFDILYKQNDIYKSKYEGMYCVSCESFFTELQLVDGKCPDCGGNVEVKSEEAYFFKLSKYQDRLIKYIEEHPDYIQPESRKNEMINNFLKPGLQDLCVSRSSFKWGIPVTFDNNHIVYIWLDALSNYITNIGYLSNMENFEKLWPCDLHLIGKDIMRFHAIYWSIILMALNLELPKKIFGHPWLLIGQEKMSKSKGNVIYPDDLLKYFDVDSIRYYVLHEIPYANDGTITYDLLIDRINSDLANTLGNLVNRTLSMAKKYFPDGVNYKIYDNEHSNDLILKIDSIENIIDKKMNNLEVSSSIDEIFSLLRRSNKYIDEVMPWILYKEGSLEFLESVIYNLLESIRVSANLLLPYIPTTSKKILEQLNINDFSLKYNTKNNYLVKDCYPLFMRIEKEEKLKEILGEN